MGEAIIAGVNRATGNDDLSMITDVNDSVAGANQPSPDQTNTSSKRRSTAGEAGSFIRNQRRRQPN